MSNNRNLGNIATAITNATSGQVLTSQGSGVATFADAAGGSSVTTVTNVSGASDSLTSISSPSVGDIVFVTSTNGLFIRKSNGWFKIADVTNAQPTTLTGVSDSALAIDGTPTTITLAATDPEGLALTFSAAAKTGSSTTFSAALTDGNTVNALNGSTVIATVAQASNVFTITPNTASNVGTVDITFSVTDSINAALTDDGQFTLTFQVWSSSATKTTVTDSSSSYTGYGTGPVASNSDGTHLIIPACRYNSSSGAVVYWTRSGTTFTEQGKLGLSLSGSNTYAGRGCAGNRDLTKLFVSNANGYEYWTRSGSTWTQRTVLASSNATACFAFSDSSNYILCNETGQRYVIGTSGTTALGNWSASLSFSSYNANRGPCAISGNGNYVILANTESSYAIYHNGSSSNDGSWGTANSPTNSMGSNSQQFSTTSNIQANTADSYGVALNRDGSLAAYTDHNYGVNIIKRTNTSWSITQRFTPNSSTRWSGLSMSEDGDVILLTAEGAEAQIWEGSASSGTGYTQSATYDDSSYSVYPYRIIANTSSALSRDGRIFFLGIYDGFGGDRNFCHAYTP